MHDSTSFRLPDARTTTWRGCGNTTNGGTATRNCGLQLDLLTGAIMGLDRADGRAADRGLPVQHANLPAGSLYLADRGLYHRGHLNHLQRTGCFG